jgi:hypothetical protein
MSISITDTPDTYTPAYNENIFVATSTAVAQANFRFRCEVQDDTLTTIATVEVFPDANNNMVFDAHRIVENYVTSNPTLTAITELSPCADSWKQYRLKVTERYGATLANYASGVTSSIYAFNAAQRWRDFVGYSLDSYFIKTGLQVRFLSSSPSNQNIYANEKAYLHFGVQTDNLARRLRVKTYNSAGTLLQTVLIANNYYAFNPGRFIRCPAGWNLNDITGGDIVSGAQPIITSSVASWEICVTQSDGTTVLTETKTFTAQTECTPHDSYRVHFLNALGGFDSFTFNRGHSQKDAIMKKTFEPVYGAVSGGLWSYAKTNQRYKDFYIESEETLKLNSDWITDEQSTWLRELIESPEIYYELNGVMYSAHVKNADYTTKLHVTDPIFNLEIELETTKDIRQRW